MPDPATHPLTACVMDDRRPLELAARERAGGYEALRKALKNLSPQDVQDLVGDAKLRGRGGAGFGTAMKWGFVPLGDDAPHPKYFVVNADEMEPGTFKDRLLLESDPHVVLEGAILGSYAVGADVCYVFLRWAYREAEKALRRAVAELEDAGLLGRDILGSGWDLELHVHVSAGRYICGEETGLLNALEGKRAVPRAKPPYPQASGLWGMPTVVQNVETVACLPGIVARGARWFRDLGRTDDAGTKLYGMSGRVTRPGLWELPIGTPLGEILEEHAGGMLAGYELKGVLPGGASTDFLTREHLDLPLDFDHVEQAGSRLGTGTMIVLDDGTCPVGMVLNLERFFARESCGWCTPCREGLPWAAQVLAAVERGEGRAGDLELLAEQCRMLGPGHTYCMLAPGAAEPLQSALKHFHDDFAAHIEQGCCPWDSAGGDGA